MFQLRVQWYRWRICKRLLLGARKQLHPHTIPGDQLHSLHTYGLFQEHMRCVVDLKDWNPPFKHIFDNMTADQTEQIHKENRDNAPVTGYYQWVTFVMAIQAAIFYFPHKVTF